MAVILGVKGSEWAWQNRRFESVEQFKTVQKKWAMWGVIIFALVILLIPAVMVIDAIHNVISRAF